ncbi:glycosyltransferase family 2 protein [Deinococcus yavapaiensis]|uniref:Rhamnopyranosyl-N-acetylglucosaminyl-diphospho-decaprenol beta-1,3/1,4-galactofuranosyltransferase n=1 Tax=Deinococcus yavapaiensis KR-236 TaxID=694435 RepID=A0A318SBM0_9DEIO|nr:glycosyltransferase family 2 protein [Deinococcus yavapaiensis]PYE55754.1 rhamnopyranosyl-N-acetylglucosaminyl-diphospho-decaprenol beta-1,3/1,4-galactofuranosyltransferase [Deinococcus yavapaiensis KR-236]
MNNGVCAIIVTFNRKHKLVECLRRVEALTVRPQHVLVVDNASTDGTGDVVREQFPHFDLLTLDHNVGGAGGFSAGMRRAYAAGFEYVWLFDDDAFADPACLERLLAEAPHADVVVPMQIDQAGRRYGVYHWDNGTVELDKDRARVFDVDVFAFVGPLMPRHVIQAIGLPREDFFICADDLEYSLRIKNAGFRTVCVADAVFHHDYGGNTVTVKRWRLTSIRRTSPAWKNYYNTRNDILIARTLAPQQTLPYVTHLLRKHVRSSLGEAVFDVDFAQKWKYTTLGVVDGVLNRSGKRLDPASLRAKRP